MAIAHRIRVARGDAPADLILENARIIDVFSGDIRPGAIAVAEGWIVGVGQGDRPARHRTDLGGRYVCPGFIDPHIHIESAMTVVSELARALLPRGTTSIVADPHEIANVLGAEGLRYMLAASEDLPLSVYFTLPSCVPATDLETAGAALGADDLIPFMDHPRVVGLGEMMNYPGVIDAQTEVLAKITAAADRGLRIDGHAPGVSGRDLAAYLTAGIRSDHECTSVDEAREKLADGMHIMIREGSCARNLHDLLPLVSDRTAARLLWCTDDRNAGDLMTEGHIDHIIREAVNGGVDPVTAIRMATLHPARYFGLRDRGAVAPGRWADLVVFSDLARPVAERVYRRGEWVAEDGAIRPEVTFPDPVTAPSAMRIPDDEIDLSVEPAGRRVRVIELIPGQIVTRAGVETPRSAGGRAVADPDRDILKLAVVERYTGRGGTGIGFVRGFGLKRGALASSVAHDSHNLIAVGADDAAIQAAIRAVARMGGGLAVADGAAGTIHRLPLPVAGLMSTSPVAEVREGLDRLVRAAADIGCTLPDPFGTLSFLALPVIPELKLTDRGLVDGTRFVRVPLFLEET